MPVTNVEVLLDAVVGAAPEPLYYIQDTRSTCGNSVVWWAVDGGGYTSDLDKAWKVSGTWHSDRKTDVLRLCSEIDAGAERHFDAQKLRKLGE